MKDIIEAIAACRFKIETLETRNSDSLDFHDLAVWQIKAALEDAFRAGQNALLRQQHEEKTGGGESLIRINHSPALYCQTIGRAKREKKNAP